MTVYCIASLIYCKECCILFIVPLPVASLPLPSPTRLSVFAMLDLCDTLTLQWTQPDEPAGITTSVSCTPSSPGCAECITSPCNITGLNPSTEYEFTVTLNSGACRASMYTTTARTRGESPILLDNFV